MRSRVRYIPVTEAHEGMVLLEPAKDPHLRTILPKGIQLTDEQLQQLQAHRVELVCVSIQDARSDEEVAADASMMAKRVLDAFESADLSDPVTAALFNQVLTYRSA
ncbi:MAG: hypothetical protein ACR2I0_15335 [Rhodoferax sp.]